MPKGLKSLARLLDTVPFAPVAAILFGLAAGILVLATPGWLFERAVFASGLPGMVAAAAPPLGDKARIMATIIAVSGTAATLWLVLGLLGALIKPSVPQSRGHRIEPVYDEPEGEPQPITPVRRPLFADADLGAPFMSDEAIAHARDELVLDTLAPDEALETPEPPEAAPAADAGPDLSPAAKQPPISGLLDRLEQALEQRERRTGSSAPILPGDMASLREALGGSQLRH